MKRLIFTIISAFAVCMTITGCVKSDSEPVSKPVVKTPSSYRIVVDEETLVQYIQWNDNPDFPTPSGIGGMTVRVKEDGTPYTIDREDLDKYDHFLFNKKGE